MTVRHECRVDGRLAVTEEQDVVYRSQSPGAARSLRREPAPEPSADFRLDVTPDEAMLFRFSALTYNSHRIHYDHPYVTSVEGYPGLVVHGPLLALLVLEIPRRQAAEVTAFDYRLTTPAFAGERIVVTGTTEANEMALSARAAGYAESISGKATLR